MAIQALIVDQASGVRSLVARVMRAVGCATHEAADGGEAVEVLQSTHVDIAVIEAEAALLSGLDLLRLVRESDTYANLPVVILTAGTDQAALTEMVRLGAADCLTKPFDVELIRTRLQRIIKSISSAGALNTVPSSDPGASGSALIVDRNPEFRQFVAGCLAASYATTQMETGLDALRACQVRKFSVLVMGTETGLLSPRLLARRLRRQATLEDMRLVMVAPTEGVVEDREAFDAVVPRTFVAADFIRHFRRLFVQPRPGEPPVLTELRESVIAATQQTLGMMIGAEMALIEGDAPQVPDDAGASMLFTVEREPSPVAATLTSDAATARRLAALLTGRADDQVGPEDGVSALSQVLTVVSGSVQADIGADGRAVTVTVPTPRSSSANPGAPGPTAVLSFASADGTLRLAISLTLAESAADATLAAAS